MHILIIVISILLSAVSVFAAEAPENYREETKRLIDSKEYSKAEELLNKLLSEQPNSADYHQLLGDVLRREGKLEEAIGEYEKARALGKDNAELLKGIASTYKSMKLSRQAKAFYEKALESNPNDRETVDDLNDLKLNRGLQIKGFIGGYEADYTRAVEAVALFYGGIDRLDLYAGYKHTDHLYYDRDITYANMYYFYRHDSYVKLSLSRESYNYPIDPVILKPNPDSTSYYKVPDIEIAISRSLTKSLQGTLTYEFSMPNFFYDKDVTATNHKVTAEISYITPLDPVKVKLFYSVLRDPDPDKTEIKGKDNSKTAIGIATATEVHYRTSSLFGGALELTYGKLNAELKYLPNRDLDDSYKYSILAKAGYELTQKLSIQVDYVQDKYSSKSNYPGETARVFMASGMYELNPRFSIGTGYKHAHIPDWSNNTWFLSLMVNTGLGL